VAVNSYPSVEVVSGMMVVTVLVTHSYPARLTLLEDDVDFEEELEWVEDAAELED
jgi:hypothetical protein